MVYGITYTVCMTLFSRIASAKSSTDSTVFVSSNVFTWRERERERERERKRGRGGEGERRERGGRGEREGGRRENGEGGRMVNKLEF